MYNVCHSKYFYMVIIIIFHGFKEAKGEGPGLIQEFFGVLFGCSHFPLPSNRCQVENNCVISDKQS